MLITPRMTTAGLFLVRTNAATVAAAVLSAACLVAPVNAAPNLVPNPSFESVSQCPTTIDIVTGQTHFAQPWKAALLSPDLFHGCAVAVSVNTPNNGMGWQWPYDPHSAGATSSQRGYAGLSLWTNACPDCREYVQVPLGQSLTEGVRYRASFFVSLADFSAYAIDRIGARLSAKAVAHVPAVGVVLPMEPQVESQGAPITDKDHWVLITGKFRAEGDEDNLIIGNFREDADLTVAFVGNGGTSVGSNNAYYYLDGVSVQETDVNDLKDPSGPDSSGMMTTILVTDAAPGTWSALYGAPNLDTSEIDGHRFDVGPAANPIAWAQVNSQGIARFSWPWQVSIQLTDPNTGLFFLEAATFDRDKGVTDSDEVKLAIGSF